MFSLSLRTNALEECLITNLHFRRGSIDKNTGKNLHFLIVSVETKENLILTKKKLENV